MDSTKLYYKSALELTRLVQKKELGCTEIIDCFYDRIEAINPHINAICTLILNCSSLPGLLNRSDDTHDSTRDCYLINYLTMPHWIPSWFPPESSKALVLIGTKDITAA
jgi:hypothetical protein